MGKSRRNKTRPNSQNSASVQRTIQQAIGLQQHGNLSAAERKYRSILRQNPVHTDALQFLGLLLQQKGNASAALHFMQKAAMTSPRNPQLLSNQAELYRMQGDFEKARDCAQQALSLNPELVDALAILGHACYRLDQPEEAVDAYSKALAINPEDTGVRNELANVYCLLGRFTEAAEQYLHVLSTLPEFDACRINLADTLVELDDTQAAIDHYQQVLQHQPVNADIHVRLARAFDKLEQPDNAIDSYQSALDIDPGLVEAQLNLGKLLLPQNPERAEDYFRAVLARDPGNANAHYWLGIYYQTLGDFDQATERFDQALELNPDLTDTWYRLSLIRNFKPSDQQLEDLEQAFDTQVKNKTDDASLVTLGFSLGRFHEQRGNYPSAFRYYQQGNQIKAGKHRFDKTQHDAQIDNIIEIFDREFFQQRASWGSPSALPVFIVGMPRSGTTLLEQILSSHPAIHGAGELRLMLNLLSSLKALDPTSAKSHAGRVRDLSQQQLGDMSARYLSDLQALQPGAKRILDKMPGNYFRLGVIFLLFPGVRIIHCKRDPMDTCWSCYQQNFEQGLLFTNDLENLGFAYRGYLRLMAHWHSVFPGQILDVHYEDLLNDPETHSRELLQHCGIDWDPAVLEFHRQQRPVSTASLWQVRQPMYKTSVGRWRAYEEFLQPLQQALFEDEKPG